MNGIQTADDLLTAYAKGQRHFSDLDFDCQIFDNCDLSDCLFKNCFWYSSFRGANLRNTRFIDGNVKTCDFSRADMTNGAIINCSVEGTVFKGAILDGFVFENNGCYSFTVGQGDLNKVLLESDGNF